MVTDEIARRSPPDKTAARIKRGQTSRQEDSAFSMLSDQELFALIDDNDAQKRTSAIRLLGERQNSAAVHLLCERLKKEPALYTRIAISEALGKIGAPAIPELIRLLSQVGHNQHDALPLKGFYKKSYPLPRDIVTRTLIKIGRPALQPLEQVVLAADRPRLLEAVDGIGHIAFYQKDLSSETVLLGTYSKYPDDPVILWKIVRALQAFPSERARRLLETVICASVYPALRWEAVRSLGQQGGKASAEVMSCIEQHACAEVKEMARIFLHTQEPYD
jgi:HEAT repeat protein